MKLLLILFTTIFLTSCDKQLQDSYNARIDFVNTLKIGNGWNPNRIEYNLIESNIDLSKYRIETHQGFYYITVKDNRIVSIWVKPKPY